MSLTAEVFVLALCMGVLSILPLLSARLRSHSRPIFLSGTGAMLGICAFDLVPDVYELGGGSALFLTGLFWLLYSAIHSLHLFHHDHRPGRSVDDGSWVASRGFFFFMVPLLAHSFASGMLLLVSEGMSRQLAGSIYLALLMHKIYEALLLASILVGVPRSFRWKLGVSSLYAASLPAGVLLASFYSQSISTRIAVVISSVAVGTLLGCLVLDFLLPSVRELRERRVAGLSWILAGLALTRVVMMAR